MISSSWLYIIGVMFLGNVITAWSGSIVISVICDLAVLAVGYYILKRDPLMDFKSNIIFLTCMTVINILRSLGLISSVVTNEAFIALLVWSWFGLHHRYFRYFIIAAAVYNGLNILNAFRNLGYLDIPTFGVTIIALLIVAYYDRDQF